MILSSSRTHVWSLAAFARPQGLTDSVSVCCSEQPAGCWEVSLLHVGGGDSRL